MAGATFAHTHAEPFQLERAELQSILDSQLFRRGPHLCRILAYICAKYFEGTAGQPENIGSQAAISWADAISITRFR